MKFALTLSLSLSLSLLVVGCAKPPAPPLPPVDSRLDSLKDAVQAHFDAEDRVAEPVNSAADHVENIRRELRR